MHAAYGACGPRVSVIDLFDGTIPSAFAQIRCVEETDEKPPFVAMGATFYDFQSRYGGVLNMHAHVLVT
ncbi:hypothetical protein D3C71_1857750 [compost metagenome]